MEKHYLIRKQTSPIVIDADWNKSFWQSIEPAVLEHVHPASSPHTPQTQVKVAYDDRAIYLCFRVQDHYVKAITTQTNGPVWRDSCVEFFFSPNPEKPETYFNIETNCCGVLLAQHHIGPRKNSRCLDAADCQKIQMASSASGPIRQEIIKSLTWTVEYALPLKILTRYAAYEKPAPGVVWRGNFYKCADDTSHPHWLMWSPALTEAPDFHRPEYFGVLEFV
jgi:hypothetical protein